MNAVRNLYESLPEIINTPAALKNRRVEVIMLPLDEESGVKKMKPCKNVNPIEKFIGAWQGEALIRCNQGEFEVREQLK